jgi:hypothetical protein
MRSHWRGDNNPKFQHKSLQNKTQQQIKRQKPKQPTKQHKNTRKLKQIQHKKKKKIQSRKLKNHKTPLAAEGGSSGEHQRSH